jgi:RNA polymerase sigma-70 factor (ECF subfamily)
VAKGNNMELSDKELIDNYLAGDERSFEILYARYRKLLYFHLHDFLKSDNIELDDIFQQTWLKAIDNLPKYQDQSNFGAYLKTIARNLIIDRARKKKRQGVVFEFNADILSEVHNDKISDMPWFELTEAEMQHGYEEALKVLSKEQRQVYDLRCQNLSFKEIAKRLNLSINTVLSQMNYAKKKLQSVLKTKED